MRKPIELTDDDCAWLQSCIELKLQSVKRMQNAQVAGSGIAKALAEDIKTLNALSAKVL